MTVRESMPAAMPSSYSDKDYKSRENELLDELMQILPEGFSGDITDASEAVGLEALLADLVSGLLGRGGRIFSFFAMLMGICLLLFVSEEAGEYLPRPDGIGAAASAGASGVSAIPIFMSVWSLCQSAGEAIRSGCSFFSGLLPIMTAVCSLSGGGATAATSYVGMSLSLSFISGMLSWLTPVILLLLTLSMLSAYDTSGVLSGTAGAVKNLFISIMGIVGMLLPATLSLQSVIAGAKDSMALRGMKYAIGNLVPIVGGTVSGALSTLASGVGVLSGTVGALSVGAVLFIFLAPIIELLLYRLCLRIAIFLLEFVGVGGAKRVLSAIQASLDALIATLVLSGLIFLLEIIVFIKAVGSLW